MLEEDRKAGMLNWLRQLLADDAALPPEVKQARSLLAAIDAGGVPLNPMRINQIARNLGLEVSRTAPMAETIERIRAALVRHGGSA
jgi:hypothetical protein